MKSINTFRGCLLGGAVGDALGYTVEFLTEKSIKEIFGSNGITEYRLQNDKAIISDDTQMTLFTATGILYGVTRFRTRGIWGGPIPYIYHSYLAWLYTQDEDKKPKGLINSWLVNIPEINRRRAPGNTCISALSRGEMGTIQKPLNDSKGCGGIMRVAPIGLYYEPRNEEKQTEVDLLGAEVAAITHGHDLGYIPAAALTHIINKIIYADYKLLEAIESSISSMKKLFKESQYLQDFLNLMYKAIELSQEENNDLEAIKQLGQGWVAEETLAIAIYCALKYENNFEKAIIASVNHGGDSDSTGAVTGNILGALLGVEAIPEKFLKDLELKEEIIEIADDLFNDCQISEYGPERDEVWENKYIYMSYPNKPDFEKLFGGDK